MKTNHKYQKPQIEVMEVELEDIIAYSPNPSIGITDDTEDNIDFRSRKRLWED